LGPTTAALHLKRTLAALHAQTRPADVLTIVLCGADAALTEIAASSGAEGVITAPHNTGFAAATALATPRLTGDAVWLLAQDTAPEPEALTRLAGALELAPSVAFVAPKLVRWDDRTEIVSLGVSMSGWGKSVELAADELDQGQHDGAADVLGSDVRGILVRREAWRTLAGLDPALAGADEGLDLGVRARLAGGRVTLVPNARIAVAGDGVASLPARRAGRRAFAVRTAELHRRLSYAPPLAVPLHWLSLLPLALWRTVAHLIAKEPGRVWPEWAATLLVLVRLGSIARARGRIRAARTMNWSRLAPLRVSRTQLRLRLDGDAEPTAPVRSDLRFFTGGGAWALLGALAVSVVAFPALLAWPVLGGGALAPLQATVAGLWADAGFGQRALGLSEIAPADPFAAIVAVLGTLSPLEPSRALVVLWLAALPLAVLGAWFASTRVTERSMLRLTGAIGWALAPTFLAALSEGRPTGVLVHLLLPWLFYTASVAHRSWAAAGAASLLFAATLACAPSLGPALIVLWAAAMLLAALVRRGRGVAQFVWVIVPAVVMFAPLVWHQLRAGRPWALLADPGVPFAGDVATPDAIGRAFLAAGFPTSDPGGWGSFLPAGGPVWWVPLLIAPIAVLALLSVLTPRWTSGAALLVIAASGLATAFAAVGVAVSFSDATPVALWPGSGLSLAWLGAIGAAVLTLDAGIGQRMRAVRPLAAVFALVALTVAAVPVLTGSIRNELALTNGPASTLPAYVAAEGRDDDRLGTIVLDPMGAGMRVRVVWGGSETLGGQSTVLATRTGSDASDAEIARLAADLVTSSAEDAVGELATRGIGFVLLAPSDDAASETTAALQLAASTSLDQRNGLDPVGETARGTLWRVTGTVEPREAPPQITQDAARVIAGGQIGVLIVALLLAVPTTTSRGIARRSPRIVGPNPGETR
jgi:hypothetical protein